MENSLFVDFAARKLESTGMIDRKNVLDGTVVRVPKTYRAYFCEYTNSAKRVHAQTGSGIGRL
jgi:hypothetical protein